MTAPVPPPPRNPPGPRRDPGTSVSSAAEWIDWARRKAEAANGRTANQGQQPQSAPEQGQRPPYAIRRGNTRHPGVPFADRAAPPESPRGRHDSRDESDPRRPADPPWRGRTARRTSTPAAMAALRGARLRRGWTLTRAAGETGVSRPHLSLLERGLRRPSESVAEAVITAYRMTPAEADAVSAIAVPWAGRDSPYRTGVEPGEW